MFELNEQELGQVAGGTHTYGFAAADGWALAYGRKSKVELTNKTTTNKNGSSASNEVEASGGYFAVGYGEAQSAFSSH